MKQKLKKLDFFDAYKIYWEKAFEFKGRSRRKEVWAPTVFNFFISFAISFVFAHTLLAPYITLFVGIIFFIPNMAITFRRSADINLNPILIVILLAIQTILLWIVSYTYGANWMYMISHIGTLAYINIGLLIISFIIGALLFFMPGKKGETKYGKDPKYFFFDESIDENMYEHIEYVMNQRKERGYSYNVIKSDLINNKGLSTEFVEFITNYVYANYDELVLVFNK